MNQNTAITSVQRSCRVCSEPVLQMKQLDSGITCKARYYSDSKQQDPKAAPEANNPRGLRCPVVLSSSWGAHRHRLLRPPLQLRPRIPDEHCSVDNLAINMKMSSMKASGVGRVTLMSWMILSGLTLSRMSTTTVSHVAWVEWATLSRMSATTLSDITVCKANEQFNTT